MVLSGQPTDKRSLDQGLDVFDELGQHPEPALARDPGVAFIVIAPRVEGTFPYSCRLKDVDHGQPQTHLELVDRSHCIGRATEADAARRHLEPLNVKAQIGRGH